MYMTRKKQTNKQTVMQNRTKADRFFFFIKKEKEEKEKKRVRIRNKEKNVFGKLILFILSEDDIRKYTWQVLYLSVFFFFAFVRVCVFVCLFFFVIRKKRMEKQKKKKKKGETRLSSL
ncbi:hypothetical protein, unlikely [Trypanosoma brucei gambiense DAL972]|uniref:Uncharacterized protein n=1 Tax=Trypanosoma brucei gambiense (strain MHOM/CI/86/DAL972) TaxID=679716 RepID=C9ZMH8_TRYB9|nr:hypothetical protein, unlikely [Trypanosoma brucei gambiense DAL972]CBH10852.1 hypothetical protein, unlikely [Trypanosoma brucei gambiense DAL972]|eukprot:XP_011773139.1 hypothetical protein, unlikely [Trypanosoma brucei gambiense DAL972]